MDFVWAYLGLIVGLIVGFALVFAMVALKERQLEQEKKKRLEAELKEQQARQKRMELGLSRSCMNCRFAGGATCFNPKTVDLTGLSTISSARLESGPCGIEGKFWEEKA